MLRSEPPLDEALDIADVPAHPIRLSSISAGVLDGLQSDTVAAVQEVIDRIFLLHKGVILPPKNMNRTRTKLLQFLDQTARLIPADAIKERLGELEA